MTHSSTIFCDLFSNCPCQEIKENPLHPPISIEMKEFFENRGVVFSQYSDKLCGWRMRAKLAVRGSAKNPQIGLFKEGTHQVIPIPNCAMHHPSINKAVSLVKNAMIKENILPYQEGVNKGIFRYLQLVVQENTGLVQLTLILFSETAPKEILQMIDLLKKDAIWHSIWLNFHPTPSNRIWGDQWQCVFGDSFLKETANGLSFYFHPGSFAQANFSLFEKMLLSIKKKIHPQKRVVEFYAGMGIIGFHVLENSVSVVCSDLNPFAESCFDRTKKDLSPSLQEKISYKTGGASLAGNLIEGKEVVILDPPRKGIDPLLLEKLQVSDTLEQIIYVSCYWRSCKRDIEKLEESGWKITQAEGYLFFPGMDHLETLCILEKMQ